jgi:hypothetical protein
MDEISKRYIAKTRKNYRGAQEEFTEVVETVSGKLYTYRGATSTLEELDKKLIVK